MEMRAAQAAKLALISSGRSSLTLPSQSADGIYTRARYQSLKASACRVVPRLACCTSPTHTMARSSASTPVMRLSVMALQAECVSGFVA